MSREIDPEVLADLRLRDATERDPNRSREMPAFVAAPVVARVPCRGRCGVLVDWTDVAEERFVMFNRQLEARGEAPMDKTRIMACAACRAKNDAIHAQRNRLKVDELREMIRELKQAANPDSKSDLIAKIRAYGHPDVDGLLEALRNRNKAQPGKRSKGDL